MFALPLVRLVGGSHLREGIVQVYLNDTWGSVCDQMWDKKDADVACRMLGYTESSEDKNGAFYGKGSDTLWLSNLQCAGNEDSLFSCVHDGLKNHTCAGGKEATVFCLGPDGNVELWILYLCKESEGKMRTESCLFFTGKMGLGLGTGIWPNDRLLDNGIWAKYRLTVSYPSFRTLLYFQNLYFSERVAKRNTKQNKTNKKLSHVVSLVLCRPKYGRQKIFFFIFPT